VDSNTARIQQFGFTGQDVDMAALKIGNRKKALAPACQLPLALLQQRLKRMLLQTLQWNQTANQG
jgi:hypothetical protein